MGRYLNSQTRGDAVIITGMVNELNVIANRWNTKMKNPPEKVVKYLRSASSFAASAMRALDKDLDDDEIARLFRMAETTSFKLAYTQFDLSSKAPDVKTYDVTEDERDNIVEALAEVRCNGCKGNIKDCTVRSQFFKWDVPPIYEVTDKKHPCQYMSN